MTDLPLNACKIAVDAHVHLYECFDLCELFTSAHANLTGLSGTNTRGESPEAVIVVTETSAEKGFRHLQEAAQYPDKAVCSGRQQWYCESTSESNSLRLRSDAGKSLFVIAGSQIVVNEGLEVHALATGESFSDGTSLRDLIKEIHDAGGLAAMPWGAGKWLGRRGRLMKSMHDFFNQHGVLLSDSGIRPWLWPRSSLFNSGLGVIAGTDPLPIPVEASRAGSFGFTLDGPWDSNKPAASLKNMLRDTDTRPSLFGESQGVMQFMSSQYKIRK